MLFFILQQSLICLSNIHPMPYMISSNIPASRQNLILTCRRPLIHQQNRVVILCKFPFLDIFVILNISCIIIAPHTRLLEFRNQLAGFPIDGFLQAIRYMPIQIVSLGKCLNCHFRKICFFFICNFLPPPGQPLFHRF